ADLPLAVLPAQVDLPAVTQVREVHEAEPEVLRDAAELRDPLEPVLHPPRQLLDALGVGAPPSPVEDPPAGQRDPLPLRPEPLAQPARLLVSGHHPTPGPR